MVQSATGPQLLDPAGTQAPAAQLLLVPVSAPIEGIATHYGAGYAGQSMACGGFYASDDASISAVSLARDREWECGVHLDVCGLYGCLRVVRQDSCPGCDKDHIDLSEAGITFVCGDQADVCDVTIQALRPSAVQEPPSAPAPPPVLSDP